MCDDVPEPVLRAAEVRAHGGSWQLAADEAQWSLAGLRTWIRRHQALWARELGRARREARNAACDEAVATLRKHLRTREAKASLGAASTLTARFAGPDVKKSGESSANSMLEIQRLSDEELAALVWRLEQCEPKSEVLDGGADSLG